MAQSYHNQRFLGDSQVYLASADLMSLTLQNCKILEDHVPQAFTFMTVIGGLSGLNYIQYLKPKNIIFYDINEYSINYLVFILELIKISNSNKDFISRMFCRNVDEFEKAINQKLDYKNQQLYLDLPVDEIVQRDTYIQLSDSSKNVYNEYIFPRLENEIKNVCNCRKLLPCWKIDERVPVEPGSSCSVDKDGCYVPNINTFFYGYGWLTDEESFNETKKVLQNAKNQAIVLDVFNLNPDQWITPGRSHVIHVSNINDFFPEKWNTWCNTTSAFTVQKGADCVAITSHRGIYQICVSPHCRAYEAISPFIYGNVVEITHRENWGFYEFKPETIVAHNYLERKVHADTIILHILLGNKINDEDFYSIVKKAAKESNRLIVMEHDEKSLDWIDERIIYPRRDETIRRICKIINDLNKSIKNQIDVHGIKDNKRSYLLVIE